MTPEAMREAINARPEATLHERAAAAAYEDALEAQHAGIPSSVRAGRLGDWARVWRTMEAELEVLDTSP